MDDFLAIEIDSAVTYALGVTEILARSRHVAERTYQHFWIYILAGFIFLLLTYIGTKLFQILEEKVKTPGYTQ